MCSKPLRVAGVVGESITDGPGIRFAIFTQGCPHDCPGCHNPQSHDPNGGEIIDVAQLWQRIAKNPLLSGVTLSGGEPFAQAEALLPLAQQIHDAGMELAVYSGYRWEEIMGMGEAVQGLLGLCDVLIDGRYVAAERSLDLNFRGSRNQRILDVPRSLASGQPVLLHDGRWQE